MEIGNIFSNNTVKVAIIVVIVVLFMTESFYFGGGFFQGGTPSAEGGKNVSGTAAFSGTIRTYDPVVLVPINTSQSVIEKLRLVEGVSAVRTDTNYPDFYIVDTDTRDDVYPVGEWLRSMNVSSLSIANVAVARNIEVETATGKVNATLSGGVVRVVAEPLLDTDSEVSVSMVAIMSGNEIIDYRSASLAYQNVELALEARVEGLEGKDFTYSIPWENRTGLGNLSRFGDAEYRKVDSIIFITPLNVAQIMAKKQFSYITYIDASSAQVEPAFDNATLLSENFKDTPYTLPQSSLTITSNETPDLPYAPEVSYTYVLRLSDTGYDFGNDTMVLESGKEYGLNSTVTLNVTALVLGDKVISVKRVSLPS